MSVKAPTGAETVAQSVLLPRIAVAGNPNTGKSTLFNRLTGLRQRIANYPGVTVEKKMGTLSLGNGREATLIDLPGSYSLAAHSADERIAIDVLTGNVTGEPVPDAVLCVVDATNLKRNLYLAAQIADHEIPIVVALTMWDDAEKRGLAVDCEALSQSLGVPVIPTVASHGEGIAELKEALARALEDKPQFHRIEWPTEVSEATIQLQSRIEKETGVTLTRGEVRRILFDRSSAICDRIGWTGPEAEKAIHETREMILRGGLNPLSAEAVLQYRHLDALLEGSRPQVEEMARRSRKLDTILTHRVFGLIIFIGLMTLVFQAIYYWAGPLMDLIEGGKVWLQDLVAPALASAPALQSLVTNGMIEGVGAVIVFLPQILILFFFISLLEDSGYMARAAVLMDKLFGWCGLNGKSFVPLLSSYACAIPGIMATRTIEDPKARLSTILIAPLMSCSARLPVYVLLIGAFIEPIYGAFWAGIALLGMHLVGLVIGLPIAWLLNKVIFKTPPLPFILEMPNYRRPNFADVLRRMYDAGKEFVVKAGTIIFAFTIVIWAMLYFPRPASVEEETKKDFLAAHPEIAAEVQNIPADELDGEILGPAYEHQLDSAYIEQSVMGRLGKGIQPIFAPAGFDWKITVGVLASFPAREVIISTLGIIYSLGGDTDEEDPSLRTALANSTWKEGPRAGQPVFTLPVAFAIMIFFALCLQCGATVAIIVKESNWFWGVVSFVYMTALAWLGAVLTFQIGNLMA